MFARVAATSLDAKSRATTLTPDVPVQRRDDRTRRPHRGPDRLAASEWSKRIVSNYSRPFFRSFSTLCGIDNKSRLVDVNCAQCLQLQRSTTRWRPAIPRPGTKLGIVKTNGG